MKLARSTALALGLACTAYAGVAAATTVYGYPVCTSGNVLCYQHEPATSFCAAGGLPTVIPEPGSSGTVVDPTPHLFMLHLGASWAGADVATQQADVAAWSAIGTDARFWAPLAEYMPGGAINPATDAGGTILFGSAVDTTSLSATSGNISDAQLYSLIAADINAGSVDGTPIPNPKSEPGIVYVVRLPTNVGTVECPLGGASCGSYHTWINTNYGTAYVAIITGNPNFQQGQNPYFSTAALRGQDIVISHEVYEIGSDPTITGYYDPNFCGHTEQEVADLCETIVADPIDGYTVSTMYSNSSVGCIGPSNLDTSTPAPLIPGSCLTNPDTLEVACRPRPCFRVGNRIICAL